MKLGELCDVVRGSSPRPKRDPRFYGGTVPRLMVADLTRDGKVVSARIDTLTELGAKQSRSMTAGDVVIAVSGAPGLPAILAHDACIHDGFVGLRELDRERLDADFLYAYLTFIRATSNGQAVGAIFKNLTTDQIKGIDVPELPLAEQRRIAEVLDRAEALRAKRRAALAQLDSLTQSLFLDLFGDPASNPKGWPRKKLIALGDVSTGRTPPSAIEGMFDGPIPFVTPGDLETDEPVRRSVTEAGAAQSRTVRRGAAFVCCIGATIGKMAIARERSAFNQQINAVEWFDETDDAYGLAALRFFKPTIKAWGASTTLPILKKSSFEKIELPLPPLHLQREFARRSGAVERMKVVQRASLESFDDLFAALQQRAFRGDL